MKEKKSDTKGQNSELLLEFKETLIRFEELRGFL